MKKRMPEQSRVIDGLMGSDSTYGANGAFLLPRIGKERGQYFQCIVSDGMGWDHVSVSIPSEKRCPTWDEMCYIKSIFFNPDECVVQYHPAESEYVNVHKYCLHLWRCQDILTPIPESIMVG